MSIITQIVNHCICNYLLFLNPTIILSNFFAIICSVVKYMYVYTFKIPLFSYCKQGRYIFINTKRCPQHIEWEGKL